MIDEELERSRRMVCAIVGHEWAYSEPPHVCRRCCCVQSHNGKYDYGVVKYSYRARELRGVPEP